MQVKDILKIKGGQIFSIGPDAPLPQAVSLMVEHDIGSLVVMEKGQMTDNHVRYLPIKDNGALIGVLSFHDVAKASLRAASFENKLLKQYIKNWPEQDKA